MKLPRMREMSGLTQWQVARRSGVDRSTISLAEGGDIKLRPEQETSVRKVLLEEIESKAKELQEFVQETKPCGVSEVQKEA
jgi:DNA-binding XRE family transcriptional regulator